MPEIFRDAQSAFSFVQAQTYNIEQQVYEVRYPEYNYGQLVPVVTEGNEWGRGTLFYSMDGAGKAEWINGGAFDMPYADVQRTQHSRGFHMAGIGYEWNLEEVNVARIEGINLTDTKARMARRVAENFLWNIALSGRNPGAATSEKGWTGLINDAGVVAADVAANGTGSSTFWADKTPDQINADINAALTGIYTGSYETEMANTVLLPTATFEYLASTPRSANSETTIMGFVQANNVYTQRTGQPLLIRGLRSLATADPGGDGRMVTYRRDPEVLRFHLPMPHRFLPLFQKGSMMWEVAGIMRTGGTEIRLPAAVRYSDGILNS